MVNSLSAASLSYQPGTSTNNPTGPHFIYDFLKPLIESIRQQTETAVDEHPTGTANVDYLAEKTADSIKNICLVLQVALAGNPETVEITDDEDNPLALIEINVDRYKEINVVYLDESFFFNISFDRLSELLNSFNQRCSADIIDVNPVQNTTIKPTREELEQIHNNIDNNLKSNGLYNNNISCIVSALYMRGYDKDVPSGYTCPKSIIDGIDSVMFDISLLAFGAEKKRDIGKDPLMCKQHETRSSSYLIELLPKDLLLNLTEITKEIKNSMGDKCILLTNNGITGHYVFYDTKNDIVISGGFSAFEAGASGISLEKYMHQKYSYLQKERIRFFFTNCTPEEIERYAQG